MSRIAALYDVHGNLPALEAALAAADDAGADHIVFGGDLVLGPMPRETLEHMLRLVHRATFIKGNCDRLVVAAFDGHLSTRLPREVGQAIEWCAAQLDRSQRDFLATLPATATLRVEGVGDVLFCHATPRSDDEIVTAITDAERVAPMLAGVAQEVVVCGHTHMQYDRRIGDVRLINAGSVGMPYGDPGAHWLLFDGGVRFVRTGYAREPAASRIAATKYPGSAEFAARHVLDPPSEAEGLRLFASR